jgi:hypothetical protein
MTARAWRAPKIDISAAPRVVVVGHCGAGKSTLVAGLRERGIDAVTSAQEHSIVPDLWRRRGADLLVYLDIDLESIRRRRGHHWPEAIYRIQETRLAPAREAADIVIDTGHRDLSQTMATAEDLVRQWRRQHGTQARPGAD